MRHRAPKPMTFHIPALPIRPADGSFRTWLQHCLSPEALQDLAHYGASLSAVPGLVFWDDMEPLFLRFRADIEEVAAFYGDLATLAARGKAKTVGQLINTLVWLAAEHHARQLVAAAPPADAGAG